LDTLKYMTGDAHPMHRRSTRKPVRKAIVLMFESDDPENPHPGVTLDMSAHGARIEAQAELTPGQTLSLIQPDDPTHAVRCLVVWAGDVSSDTRGQAGLEFLDRQAAREN